MSARITAGMLCYIRDGYFAGRTVTTVRYVGRAYGFAGVWVDDAWDVESSWDNWIWAFASCLLVPIASPDIDTTETTDALHDSLVAVLAEARP